MLVFKQFKFRIQVDLNRKLKHNDFFGKIKNSFEFMKLRFIKLNRLLSVSALVFQRIPIGETPGGHKIVLKNTSYI